MVVAAEVILAFPRGLRTGDRAPLGAVATVTGRGLASELAQKEAIAPQLGTTQPGATKPITVTAESEIGGVKIFDTNQTARPTSAADANKPTLIADKVPAGDPNSNMANAHAEVAVIQRAYDAGLTKGQDMSIVVRGESVCNYCLSETTGLRAMAEAAGLKSLTIIDTDAGVIRKWTPGDNRFVTSNLH